MSLPLFMGIVAAISLSGVMMPGPIFANAIYEGRKNKYAGFVIAAGHSMAEVPIIVALFFIGSFQFPWPIKPMIGIAGGLFLLYLAFSSLRARERKLIKGIIAGILLSSLNPYFIMWWLTIGLNLAIKATYFGIVGLITLIVVHEICDFSWYGFVSILSNKGAKFQKMERIAIIISFALLLVFGFYFIYSGAFDLLHK